MVNGTTIVKYTLILANLVSVIAGLVFLGFGAIVVNSRSPTWLTLANMSFTVAPITAMVAGGVIFVVAFIGFYGAIRESYCSLIMYSVIMFLLIIANLVLATLIFVKKDVLVSQVGPQLDNAFQLDRKGFQDIEITFHCCGPWGPDSYPNPFFLPHTCCPRGELPCEAYQAYPSCTDAVTQIITFDGKTIGVWAFVVASVELLVAVLALTLAYQTRDKLEISPY